ncbi:MAG: hypothetical protein MZV70_02310 [Desulfobacterales bacterium]|nr:hypothetical protein [Desulfobacterales bacterium]
METAVGIDITFTAVMMVSAALSWVVFTFIMVPLGVTFLKIIVFIGIVAGLVQASDTVMRKVAHRALLQTGHLSRPHLDELHHSRSSPRQCGGAYVHRESLLQSRLQDQFALALIIMAGIREKLELADVPAPFKGTPDGLRHYRADRPRFCRVFRM